MGGLIPFERFGIKIFGGGFCFFWTDAPVFAWGETDAKMVLITCERFDNAFFWGGEWRRMGWRAPIGGVRIVWVRLPNTGKGDFLAWFEMVFADVLAALGRGERLVEVARW